MVSASSLNLADSAQLVFRDILRDLASVSELPLPHNNLGPTFKRERDSDEPIMSENGPAASSSPLAPQPEAATRTIAGSRRVSNHATAAAPPSRSASHLYALPLHSEELGRMPLHPTAAGSPSDAGSSSDAASPLPSWYQTPAASAYGVPAPASVPQPAHSAPSSVPHVQVANPMDAMSTFQMDPIMYDQMMSSFAGTAATVDMAPVPPPGYGGYPPPQPGQPMSDSDTIAMWSTAPSGFECVTCTPSNTTLLICVGADGMIGAPISPWPPNKAIVLIHYRRLTSRLAFCGFIEEHCFQLLLYP
jgi:hypothetical protein